MLLVAAMGLGLAGCSSSSMDDLRAELDAIKKKPRGKIDPPPEFNPMPTFTYAAHQLRSPFAPPIDLEQVGINSGKKVEPDTARAQEYLERFNLESLRMKGILDWSKTGRVLGALVEDESGQVHRLRIGNYLGKNHGKIVDISPTQISIIEIVPDGRDGWVERPRTLTMSE